MKSNASIGGGEGIVINALLEIEQLVVKVLL